MVTVAASQARSVEGGQMERCLDLSFLKSVSSQVFPSPWSAVSLAPPIPTAALIALQNLTHITLWICLRPRRMIG